ncbi:hypothetical protein CJ030_MR2G020058 [Morella rubra]|uniref:Uncharacterized protein n=1 Tax=Morella rubra TaxID=262757 RepID=A0A6A1WCK6_9ROSI|nr:hypothetical protein CJ030_MR2G020058 [Morella rubra]
MAPQQHPCLAFQPAGHRHAMHGPRPIMPGLATPPSPHVLACLVPTTKQGGEHADGHHQSTTTPTTRWGKEAQSQGAPPPMEVQAVAAPPARSRRRSIFFWREPKVGSCSCHVLCQEGFDLHFGENPRWDLLLQPSIAMEAVSSSLTSNQDRFEALESSTLWLKDKMEETSTTMAHMQGAITTVTMATEENRRAVEGMRQDLQAVLARLGGELREGSHVQAARMEENRREDVHLEDGRETHLSESTREEPRP